ncbi:hypothetical protein IV203_022757 [Nitzschia inconspicua]|uniref:Uncharacterized protein n=1 Tax=Nitzschia inconspicua TaxID=303405 RepID=A0A9K3K4N2_9STRA|nr:hypothetical protein IV203_022757 [Nitzschia inconspicua]
MLGIYRSRFFPSISWLFILDVCVPWRLYSVETQVNGTEDIHEKDAIARKAHMGRLGLVGSCSLLEVTDFSKLGKLSLQLPSPRDAVVKNS